MSKHRKQLLLYTCMVSLAGGIVFASELPKPEVRGGKVQDAPAIEPMSAEEKVKILEKMIQEERKKLASVPATAQTAEVAKIEEDKVLTAYYKWMTKTPFKFKVSGMARLDSFFDSRQGWEFWHGLDFDAVKAPRPDPNGCDVHDKARFTIVPWPELKLDVFGPDVWKAKTSAVFRTDMVGRWIGMTPITNDFKDTFNCIRMKHAYLQFDWEKTSLRCGKYYHPIAMPELSPDTVSVNSGETFDPFEYSTFFMVRHKFDPFEIVAAVGRTCLRNFERNAIMPHIYLRLNAFVGDQMFCIGNDFRAQVVRLFTDKSMATNLTTSTSDIGYKESEFIPGFVPFVAASLKKGKYYFKTRLLYAQNASEYDVMGGWGVCQRDPATDRRHYTGLRCINYWFDNAYVTEKWEVGGFFGIAKNLGSRYKIQRDPSGNLLIDSDYFWLLNVDRMFRIQPRIRLFHGPVTVGLELEYTRAYFGTLNDYARVCNACPTAQTRVLMSLAYSF